MADISLPANAEQARRWNGQSGQFWITHRERHLNGHRRLVPQLFAAAGIRPGDRVLDVGCGCGATTIAAARAASATAATTATAGPEEAGLPGPAEPGHGGSALGVDLSGPMLEVARRLAAEAGVRNAAFEQADVQVCPLRRDYYDVMISSFGVMFFDDPAAAFANITAALRYRGRLAFLCWQDDMINEVFAIALREFRARTPAPGPAATDLFADPRQVTRLLSGAGCADIRIEAVTEPAWVGSDVTDVMSYLRGMSMMARLTAELEDQAQAEEVMTAIARQYAARQRPDGVWVSAAAWLVTAQRQSSG